MGYSRRFREPSLLLNRARCLLVAIAIALPATLAFHAMASDHERAREGLARGGLVPLSSIIKDVERVFGGRVLEAELDQDNTPHYELEVLLPDRRLIELEYDAATGRLRKIEGPRLETLPALRQLP